MLLEWHSLFFLKFKIKNNPTDKECLRKENYYSLYLNSVVYT